MQKGKLLKALDAIEAHVGSLEPLDDPRELYPASHDWMARFDYLDAAVEQLCKVSDVTIERGADCPHAFDIIENATIVFRGTTNIKYRMLTVAQALSGGCDLMAVANRSDWLRRMELVRLKAQIADSPPGPANASASLSPPFVTTDFQQSILDALKGVALMKDKLAQTVCDGDGSRLYKPNGIKELMEEGLVVRKDGLGYYRPDCPPKRD